MWSSLGASSYVQRAYTTRVRVQRASATPRHRIDGRAMRVGFIGIGRMGSAIAGRVLAAGYELTVWNRTPEKAAELGRDGAQVASSVAEACAGAEAVMTMLANDEVLLEIA